MFNDVLKCKEGYVVRGSPIFQATQLLNIITAFGQSKHQAKRSARASGAKNWHEIGQHMKIFSFGTANLYRSIWIELLRHAKKTCGVKDIMKLTPTIVSSFLEAKIADGMKYNSFETYCSALEKLSFGLDQCARDNGTEANNNRYNCTGRD
jgi:hypothetical protein